MTAFRLILKLSVLTVAFAVSGCASDPADSVPAAKTTATKAKKTSEKKVEKAGAPDKKANPSADKKSPAAAKQPAAEAAKKPGERALKGDLVFIGSKVTGSHECIFKEWSGTATVPGDDLTKAAFNFTVKTASVVADYKDPKPWSKKLEKHLRSSDFFHSSAEPNATFVSESVTKLSLIHI